MGAKSQSEAWREVMLGLGDSPVPMVHPVAVECCLVALGSAESCIPGGCGVGDRDG